MKTPGLTIFMSCPKACRATCHPLPQIARSRLGAPNPCLRRPNLILKYYACPIPFTTHGGQLRRESPFTGPGCRQPAFWAAFQKQLQYSA
jgi:hypothetical protein